MREGFFVMLSNRTIAGLIADLEYDQGTGSVLDKQQLRLLEGARDYFKNFPQGEQLIAEHRRLEGEVAGD